MMEIIGPKNIMVDSAGNEQNILEYSGTADFKVIVPVGEGIPFDAFRSLEVPPEILAGFEGTPCTLLGHKVNSVAPLPGYAGILYDVTATYGKPIEGSFTLQVSYEKSRIALEVDINRKRMFNTAGVPYEETIEIDRDLPVLTFVRQEKSWPSEKIALFHNTINFRSFFGYPRGCVKVNITASYQGPGNFHNNTDNFHNYGVTVTYTFICKPPVVVLKKSIPVRHVEYPPFGDQVCAGGWVIPVLDQGFEHLVNGRLTPILDPATGKRVTQPKLLDGEGRLVPMGPDGQQDPMRARYKGFEVCYYRDFRGLDLPLWFYL